MNIVTVLLAGGAGQVPGGHERHQAGGTHTQAGLILSHHRDTRGVEQSIWCGEEGGYELQLQGHPAGADPLHPQQGAVPAVLQAAHQPGIHLHQVH